MSERMAEVKVTKSLLLIPERVLWQYLPAQEIEAGIRRGKGLKRCEAVERRQEKSIEDYRKMDLFGKEENR